MAHFHHQHQQSVSFNKQKLGEIQLLFCIKEETICTVGSPFLPVLLQLLTAQARRLIDTEEAQNLLHRLGVSIIHYYGQKTQQD